MAVSPQSLEFSIARWQKHDFFNSAVVLGLDIGLEGIGVCVRRGREIIYAKAWQYDVPEAARLESRRQMRAARHCRTNRKTRLHRLKQLFEKHGLPWVDEKSETSLHTDPYILRYRAVRPTGNGLASTEALSLAIRHCVSHRGYDYEYFSDEGAYPWGDSIEVKKVLKELSTIWLTAEDARKARQEAASFEWSDEQMAEFEKTLTARTGGPDIIEKRLAQHAKGEQNHRRIQAKGEAFPRKFVWQHLEQIIKRHEHLINDAQGFLSALAINPKNGGNKEDAIFYYHRKTPAEMRKHFEKKRARCPYGEWLGIGSFFVERRGHQSIRRFSLLEFATTRDIQLADGRKVPVGEKMTERFLEWVSTNPDARTKKEAKPIIDELIDALKSTHKAKPAPNTKSPLNNSFFETLRDLLAPSVANRRKNASMSSEAAERLFAIATANGFSREAINSALKDCRPASETIHKSLYDFRRSPTSDVYGVYPQVEFLLGQRVKKDRKPSSGRKLRGSLSHEGKLQRLFKELSPQLGGKLAPDYCVVETARDLPRNLKQKQEIEAEQKKRRDEREKLFEKFGITDKGKRNERLRIKLFAQQDGVCPFSGEKLGDDPLSGALDIEHLYPESRGGLTVDENLVLTFATINRSEKKNRTPKEYAATGARSFEEMLKHTAKMRWGQFKREVFAWNTPDEIPPFGNVTRTAQLAKQLHAELTRWMGIDGDSNRIAERLGTPSGFQTAACRRAWQLPEKDRTDLTHHLVDAVILAHIPPREGQNFARYGGVFFPRWIAEKKRVVLDVLPGIGPDAARIATLTAPDAAECPIIRHRSSSNTRSLHDKTIFRTMPDGTLAYRDEFPAKETIASVPALRELLTSSGIPLTYRRSSGVEKPLIPSDSALRDWLDRPGNEPLRLLNGTPVRSRWKFCGKGNLKDDPAGFHAQWNEHGQMVGIKSILGRWDSLELWRGWNAKKKRWEYYKRLIPSPAVMRSLRSLGYSWSKKNKRPWRTNAPSSDVSLEKLLGSNLPPYARRAVHPHTKQPVAFRLGDTFLAGFTSEGKLVKRGQTPARQEWVAIKAVEANEMSSVGPGRIVLVSTTRKGEECGKPVNPDDLALLAGLPTPDDSSSYPNQRAAGPACPSGEVDFRLK